MYIVELTYPGTWLDYPDREWGWKVGQLLKAFESPLAEAAIALSWFEQERTKSHATLDRAEWEADGQRLREIQERLASELGVDRFDFSRHDELRLRAEVELKREKWNQGRIPDSYENHLIFMHAKTFLLALDRLDKLLGVLSKTPNVPPGVLEAKAQLEASLPDLRGVRNSVAHHEDRARGVGKDGKQLQLKPIDNPIAKAPGGVLILESLIGNRFGSTKADGHYGEVEVSAGTLGAATQAVQHAVASFRWKGPAEHWPR